MLEAKCLTSQLRNMIKFAFFSGLGAGEVAGLRWSNVDWAKRVAFVQLSYDSPTTSGKPRRVSSEVIAFRFAEGVGDERQKHLDGGVSAGRVGCGEPRRL